MSDPRNQRTLYVIVCAAGVAAEVHKLIESALSDGWDVWIIPTPSALDFVDAQSLEMLTGHPVRARYRRPGEVGKLPPADAVIVAPATYNSINKWANGISDPGSTVDLVWIGCHEGCPMTRDAS